MKKFIITGHGQYATGLKSSLDLLVGNNEDLIFIDFLAEMNEENLKTKMEEVINKFQDDEIIFICDILGGTPYKIAVILANQNDRIEVVAGCNVGSIIEALFQKETLSLSDVANLLVNSSKQYTVKFEKIKNTETINTNPALEEGI